MTDPRMSTFEQLREKAEQVELAGVNFLAKDGMIARKKRAVVKAEFTFIDGSKITVPKSEMDRPGFDQLSFKLRPSRNDA